MKTLIKNERILTGVGRNILNSMFVFWLIVLFSAPLLAQKNQAVQKRPLVFRNVTLIDMRSPAPQPNVTVVVSGNRISEISKNVVIPKDAQIIEASDKFLIPGLWDMHSHSLDFWKWASLLNIANGVTGIRDPATMMSLSEALKIKESVERGETIAPRFVTAGALIDGKPAIFRSFLTVETPDEMRKEISRLHREGADFIKIYTRLSRETFLAGIEEARRLGTSLDGHVPLALTVAEASDAGMRSVEHAYRHRMACATAETEIRELLMEQIRVQSAGDYRRNWEIEDKTFLLGIDTYNSGKCVELGRRFARNGTWFVPTLVEMRTRFRSEDPASPAFRNLFKDPKLRYVPAETVEKWRDNMAWQTGFLNGKMTYGARDDVKILGEMEQEVKNRLRMAADLHRGGARILAGTDVSENFPFVFFGFSLHEELELLVKAGLSPYEALKTATVNPAEFLGREKQLGTIEKGKLADLILLDANPLENISNTQKINAVVAGGKFLPKSELEKLLTQAEALANQ